MKTSLQFLLLTALICLMGTPTAFAQTAPASSAPRRDAPAASAAQDGPGERERTPSNLMPQQDWPSPVDDMKQFTFVLADVLEYRPRGLESDFRWDIEGWHGGDFNRLWFKSEGERNTALKADYDIDFQLLYGRFVRKYYDFQVGLRSETQTFGGANCNARTRSRRNRRTCPLPL
ncbi:MAG: copper resistance protein B (plasmid) [Candidatus Manganitrophus sp.]|nr:MAG: copper resistance protein B [Candidatus Manganitrophus sp.]